MSWIETVPFERSVGKLRALYVRLRGPQGQIDNVLQAQSLRPHTLEGHLGLYRSVLHHPGNSVPRWFMEAIGVQISQDNGCHYCLAHHQRGLAVLLGDASRAEAMRAEFARPDGEAELDPLFTPTEQAALRYARRLTLAPARISKRDVDALSHAGWSDGEILELNQVTAYFNYGNRTSIGLGANLAGDCLGGSLADA